MSERVEHYDVIVVGGGPAGATAALYCARHGLKTMLVDKSRFPRDKICGDAISGKSVRFLRELGLDNELNFVPRVRATGVKFSSPNGRIASIPFSPAKAKRQAYGYVCRREVFDNVLFQAAKEAVDACYEDFTVTGLLREGQQITGIQGKPRGTGKPRDYFAKLVFGADGFNSMVARETGLYEHDSRHWVVATRSYYRGVAELSDYIEIHFVDDVLPGYFWIFPLEDGLANVGIGMLHSEIRDKGINLREAHLAAVASDYFRERFEPAELVDDIRGWNLPLGSKRRRIHGDGFMLLGDAAGLIDPFSGEGIGNAMQSAATAAQVAAEACARGDFSTATLKAYPDALWQQLGAELHTSYMLQRIGRCKPLLNLVVGKAAKRLEVAEWISGMMANEIPKTELASPLTYLRLLFV